MEFRFVAPITSAAAATPVLLLHPASAVVNTNARPATRAVIVRIDTPLILRSAADIRSFDAHGTHQGLAAGRRFHACCRAGRSRRPGSHHHSRGPDPGTA